MEKERIEFLYYVLSKVPETQANKDVIYPILQDNCDKLDRDLAKLLYYWAKDYFTIKSSQHSQALAGAISHFSILIGQFSQGNIANNLEIAIACCKVIEVIFTREAFPKSWATSKLNLGNAYGERVYGDPEENL